MVSVEAESAVSPSERGRGKELSRQERNRTIVHLARVFSRRYDMEVIPSRSKGVWATGMDPKVAVELGKYIDGERESLDDLPQEAFKPRQILYDEETAQSMSMDEISTILHHEAGHAKYTDFKTMVEGQRQAKDEGNLPTSYWITYEGIEDPRVNGLEGAESPAIDRQIRRNQAKDLQERITEAPLGDKPKMLQFAYDSFHRWLNDGQGIPELADTDVGRLGEEAKPLLEQYFQNTDLEQRKILQKQIWDIAKGLEKTDIEDEMKKQVAQQKGMKGNKQSGKGQGQGEGGQGENQGEGQGGSSQSEGGEQGGSSGGEGGEGMAPPALPGGKGEKQGPPQQGDFGPQNQNQSGQGKDQPGKEKSGGKGGQDRKGFLNRLRETIFGDKDKPNQNQEENQNAIKNPSLVPQKEKIDLSQFTDEELRQIQEAIDNLSPEERSKLEKRARETVDEAQREGLEKDLPKTLKLERNKETGEYEVKPVSATEHEQTRAHDGYDEIRKEVEGEEQAQFEREEQEQQARQEAQRRASAARQEKIEMQKAGFDENEREKFLLYQRLEDSMYTHVRNFRQAIEKVIPRRGEPVFEGGFFSGPKFDRRDLVRKAPLGDEQFHMRQTERPIGEPRLFVGLVVDNSPSMAGVKMEQARRTVIFFSKVCHDMGIPFMVSSFSGDAEVIKKFRQDFDNPAERIKPKIIDATDAKGSGTNLHAGLEVTIESMNEERRKLKDSHGVVFVITDGEANQGITGAALRSYIEENRGRLTFKAFGLSGGSSERSQIQNYLNNYFGEGNCAYPQGFEDLPDEAFRVLRINLMQFQRYLK